jgi:trafficking protein particle complex subunit 13
VFLEVHIQNLTSDPLHFERMQIECTDDWNVTDTNVLTKDNHKTLFSGSQALMQPQDIRQYIYILTPKSVSLAPVIFPPGSTIPLGRLDIFWRTSFGEPARLLTSMLSRRIPLLAPVPQPMPTLPSYIKRAITASLPSRPQSPQLSQSRPGTPSSNRPVSPSQSRSSLIGAVGTTPQPSTTPHVSDIEVNLVKRESTPTSVQLEKPFGVKFSLVLSAPMHPEMKNRRRVIRLIVQHLQHRGPSQSPHPLAPAPSAVLSSRLSSGFSTPSSPQPTFKYALADQKLLTGSPRQKFRDEIEKEYQPNDSITLPPPFFSDTDESYSRRSTGVMFTGSSALFLPSVELSVSETEVHGDATENVTKLHASQDFELSYLPRQKGYTTIGGLRVLLVGDGTGKDSIYSEDIMRMSPVVTLKEWDVVGEVWVLS